MRYSIPILFALYVATSGCVDFKSENLVEEFRVLGVLAEPPEIAPGDGARLSVLWADPAGEGREVSFAWMGCSGFVHSSEGIATCDMIVPPTVRTAAEGGDSLTIPATPPDLLDGLPPEVTSVQVTFIVIMCAGGTLPAPDEYPQLRETRVINTLCEGGDGLSAYKTIAISRSDDPNRNPLINGFNLNGESLPTVEEGGVGHVVCTETEGCDANVNIAMTVDRSSFQSYEVIEFGETVPMEEQLFLSWYVTGGEFENGRSGPKDMYGPLENIWFPEKTGIHTLYAVVHDTRGGAVWRVFEIEVHPLGAVLPL